MDAQAMISELNDHGFTDEATATKVRVLQHTVWDLEGREPWPFIEATTTLTFDGSGPAPTNLPSDFRAVSSLYLLAGSGNSAQKLRPVAIDELEALALGDYNGVGTPLVYYFDGMTLNVYPTPGAGSTAKLRYIKWSPAITDTSLETDFLIPKQYHRLIVYGALWKLYDMEDDPELSSRFEGHYEQGLQQVRATMWARQYDQSDHIRMVDPDDYYGEY